MVRVLDIIFPRRVSYSGRVGEGVSAKSIGHYFSQKGLPLWKGPQRVLDMVFPRRVSYSWGGVPPQRVLYFIFPRKVSYSGGKGVLKRVLDVISPRTVSYSGGSGGWGTKRRAGTDAENCYVSICWLRVVGGEQNIIKR